MRIFISVISIVLISISPSLWSRVKLGLEVYFSEGIDAQYAKKKIGLVTNHTGIDGNGVSTIYHFEHKSAATLVALFSPEHGLDGGGYAYESIDHKISKNKLPIYSLHGATRRPTEKMLSGIDVVFFDIQDVGIRTYTYASTLFYMMEEAAKRGIEVVVLDRPNPLGGITVDGTMLEKKWRSFVGYINVPYCHGMTIGELAQFFNEEYAVRCKLRVIPMKGWKRDMLYEETGLVWIPTSPNIPELDTPLYYATTGLLGELSLVNIGVGYSLPFKVVGADWIDAEKFCETLRSQHLPGISFIPFHFKPFFGLHKGKECHGALLRITNPKKFKPFSTQMAILGILKSMYRSQFTTALSAMNTVKKEGFCKAIGSSSALDILAKETYVTWKLISMDMQERATFLQQREKYLLYKE